MKNMDDMTMEELISIQGGTDYDCAILGSITALAFMGAQWLAVTALLIAAYKAGCFNYFFSY